MEIQDHQLESPPNLDLLTFVPSVESTDNNIIEDHAHDLEEEQHTDKVKGNNKIVFNVAEAEYDIIKQVGKNILKWELSVDPNEDWDVLWTDGSVPIDKLAKMRPYQKVNHFPGMHSIARKHNLGRNLTKMKKIFPEQYKFFPKTFVLPGDYQEFKNNFAKNKKQKTFIIKPEYESQGKGIYLTKSWENIGPKDHLIAQKYLENPFLLDGLKFDLRIYVLVAGCDPLRIYLYKEGLGRFATEKYVPPNQENLANNCMHLTNYAINKENPNFVFNNSSSDDSLGHKKSLKAVFKILKDQGHDVHNLWNEIKKIIRKVFCSIQPILSQNYKSCQPNEPYNNMCFEILGFDVMIDDKFKPWLIEVNHLPSFSADTPLDTNIKKNVLKDAFHLMNISPKDRTTYKNRRKAELHQRSLSVKSVKVTPQEREEAVKKAQKERDEWESQNHGGYEKIFPLDEGETVDEDYQEFMKVAHHYWEVWTGTGTRKDVEKGQTKTENPPNPPPEAQVKKVQFSPANKLKFNLASPRVSGIPSGRKGANKEHSEEPKASSVDPAKTTVTFFSRAKNPSVRIQGSTLDSWNMKPTQSVNQKKPSYGTEAQGIIKDEVRVSEEKRVEVEFKLSKISETHPDLTKSAVFLPKITEKPEARISTDYVNLIREVPVHLSNSLIGNPGEANQVDRTSNNSKIPEPAKTQSKFETGKAAVENSNLKDALRPHARKISNAASPDARVNIWQAQNIVQNPMKEKRRKQKNSFDGESEVFTNKNPARVSKATLVTLGVEIGPPQAARQPIHMKAVLYDAPRTNNHLSPLKRTLGPQLNYGKVFLSPKGTDANSACRRGEDVRNDFLGRGHMLLQGVSIAGVHNGPKIVSHWIREMSKNE